MDTDSILEKLEKLQKKGIENVLFETTEGTLWIKNIEKELGNLKIKKGGDSNSLFFEGGFLIGSGLIKKVWGLTE